jgi:hypothetical protein
MYKLVYAVGLNEKYTLAQAEVYSGPFSDMNAKPQLLETEAFDSKAELENDEGSMLTFLLSNEVKKYDQEIIIISTLQKGNINGDSTFLIDFNTIDKNQEIHRKIAVVGGEKIINVIDV